MVKSDSEEYAWERVHALEREVVRLRRLLGSAHFIVITIAKWKPPGCPFEWRNMALALAELAGTLTSELIGE